MVYGKALKPIWQNIEQMFIAAKGQKYSSHMVAMFLAAFVQNNPLHLYYNISIFLPVSCTYISTTTASHFKSPTVGTYTYVLR